MLIKPYYHESLFVFGISKKQLKRAVPRSLDVCSLGKKSVFNTHSCLGFPKDGVHVEIIGRSGNYLVPYGKSQFYCLSYNRCGPGYQRPNLGFVYRGRHRVYIRIKQKILI